MFLRKRKCCEMLCSWWCVDLFEAGVLLRNVAQCLKKTMLHFFDEYNYDEIFYSLQSTQSFASDISPDQEYQR